MNNPFQPVWMRTVAMPVYPDAITVRLAERVEEAASKRGNPWKRKRGEVARAVIMTVMKRETEVPTRALQDVTGLSRTGLLYHLGVLSDQRRIRGYTTANGMVKLW